MSSHEEGPDASGQGYGRLAQEVRRRRQELRLSVRAAADRGGLARGTWTSLEDGSRRTADSNFAGIELALKWAPGSVSNILAGRPPVHFPRADHGQELDPAVERVMRSSLSDEQKDRLVELLIHEREQAARMRLERAQQLIELMEVDPTRVDHASSG